MGPPQPEILRRARRNSSLGSRVPGVSACPVWKELSAGCRRWTSGGTSRPPRVGCLLCFAWRACRSSGAWPDLPCCGPLTVGQAPLSPRAVPAQGWGLQGSGMVWPGCPGAEAGRGLGQGAVSCWHSTVPAPAPSRGLGDIPEPWFYSPSCCLTAPPCSPWIGGLAPQSLGKQRQSCKPLSGFQSPLQLSVS